MPTSEMRIQRLENQLRQLTGQNEELQYRNRQLEERLRQLGGVAAAAPGGQPPVAQPSVAAVPPRFSRIRSARQPPRQPGYPQDSRAIRRRSLATASSRRSPRPRRSSQDPAAPPAGGRRRGDAFDPSQNPNAPGAPRALGGGQMPIANEAPVGAPGGRGPGEPLNLGAPARAIPVAHLPPPVQPGPAARQPRRADHAAALGHVKGRIRSRHRLHAAQGLCAGRRDA